MIVLAAVVLGAGGGALVKLLTGLYKPEMGQIRFDGQPVTDETVESYRQQRTIHWDAAREEIV